MPVNAEQLATPPVDKKRSAAGKHQLDVTIREAVESDLADTVSFLCVRDRLCKKTQNGYLTLLFCTFPLVGAHLLVGFQPLLPL
jgi:hypothetical protein